MCGHPISKLLHVPSFKGCFAEVYHFVLSEAYRLAMTKSIPLVTSEEFDLARALEKKLLAVPKDAGILFVSVLVRPASDHENTIFLVFVGCSRERREDTIKELVKLTFREETARGVLIEPTVRRGLCRELEAKPFLRLC